MTDHEHTPTQPDSGSDSGTRGGLAERLRGFMTAYYGPSRSGTDSFDAIFNEAADEIEALSRTAWPISTDGPHKITNRRRWLARQLMDSKNSDEEAFGIVAHHPSIADARSGYHERQPGNESSARNEAKPSVLNQKTVSPTPAWLPVESAPKDGTKFWAIDRHGRHFECRRISDRPGAPDVWHNLSANRWDFPTHWQPLPPPPSLIGEG